MTKRNIYIFDLHNTLYDEVFEYGCAIKAAIDHFFMAGDLDETLFYAQISAAHAQAGSDWDDDVWDDVPELKKLPRFEKIKNEAIEIRAKASKAFTKSKAFTDTLATIKTLKNEGHSIYIATEATQNAASDALFWLDLDGVIDSAYSWPFKKTYTKKTRTTPLKSFPDNPEHPGLSLQKPHPLILGQIILDHAKETGAIPPDIGISDVFDFTVDKTLDLSVLEQKINEHGPEKHIQAEKALIAIRTLIRVKDGPYQTQINDIKSRCYYVGDSFFKDGFLARNADIPFIYAAYGKNISADDLDTYNTAKDIMMRVTGWDKFLLKLTHEAGALESLTMQIKPYYTCNNSFAEFINAQNEEKRNVC